MPLYDPLHDPSFSSWCMVFIRVEYAKLLLDIITNNCPKHYMQPHTALTVLQVAGNILYFAIFIYYFPYTVSPRIVCIFVQKIHRTIRNRTV